jgi:cytochrome c-type biogenesis protein CcsB
MTSTDINTFVTFGYLALAFAYLLAYAARQENRGINRLLLGMLISTLAVHTFSIGLRWAESYWQGIGHAPLSNMYESLVFFAWSVALALIAVKFRYKSDMIAILGLPIVFLIMAYTFVQDPKIQPLIPALQSNWLVAHVITCFLGYAAFAMSFIAAVLFVAAALWASAAKALPEKILDDIVYRSVLVGLPMLTIGIVTGAAWADYAWGSYWSWDPKETWSLITWLVYSAFLHARLARGWSGLRAAGLSIVGFGAVMFTYFGVNYLPGLHSYLK